MSSFRIRIDNHESDAVLSPEKVKGSGVFRLAVAAAHREAT